MGYTRYNYRPKKRNKRNNNGNFLIMSLAVILIAVVVGLFLGPIIFKGDGSKGDTGANAKVEDENKSNEKKDSEEDKSQGENTQGNSNKEQNNVTNTTDTSKEGKEIFMIQCGYYGKKENAESALKEIPSSYNKFIIEENKKFRVIAGIYLEEEANKVSDQLTKKEIANVKIKCNYSSEDKNDEVSYEILTGFMKIINNLENKEVKSIKTTEFKNWTKKLLENKKLDKENDELKSLREHIEKLPNELDRKGAEKSLEFIYKILIKHRV